MINVRSILLLVELAKDDRLVSAGKKSCVNQDFQCDINNLINKLKIGNENPGIGCRDLRKGIFEHRTEKNARVFLRKLNDGKTIEILGKSDHLNKR
jgi:hypothetical protein